MENGCFSFSLRKANRILQLLVVHLLVCQAFLAGQQMEDRYSQLDATMQQMTALFSSGKDAQGIAVGEPALREARAMLQASDPKLVMLEMGMALAYQRLGRLQDAESLYLAVAGTSAPAGFLCDANLMLGYIADFSGRKYEANQRLRIALSLAATFLSEDKARILRIRNSLASSDLELANIPEALELSLQNLDDLRTQPEEVSHREELFNLRTLAQIYRGIGDQKREDAVYSRIQQISRSADEKQDTEFMLLGRDRERQFIQGRFAEAAKLQLQMLATREKAFPFIALLMRAKGLETLAQTYYAAGNLDLALQSFHQAFDLLHQALDSTLPFLTDSQRNEFAMQIDSTAKIFYSMCYQYRLSHPEWLPEMYDLVLWQKNLVSRSLRQQQHLLATSSDEPLRQLQGQLKELRIKLAEITRQTPNAPVLLELRQKEFSLEKQVTQRVNQLSSVTGEAPSLNSLLKVMRPADAAVEMVRLELNDGRAPTSRVLYLALVARPANAPPITMVKLGDAEDVESDQVAVNQMLKSRSFEPGAKASIPASETWKVLEPALRGARRIYLSPAGIFNQSAFLAWKVSEDKFLIDRDDLDLRPVSSTAVLLEHKSTAPASRALLIGNPNFNRFPSGSSSPADASSRGDSCEDTDLQSLICLKNSGTEIEAIYSTLKRAHWEVAPLLENSYASKTAVLAVHHPKILHIATHGFFMPLYSSGAEVDPTALEWQLENSGLFFAGANLTLKGQVNQSIDNGVLTAFETQNLDLDGTELVVLSACDTGRGQLSTADEVLGLRRSFQVAGANGILMSMWNVDDQATTDLMTKFYQEWIASGDPYIALRKAALAIKEHHSNPYYWAPFVLYSGK